MEPVRDIGVVVSDESFPEVDLALRRGRHIDGDDVAHYSFLVEYQAELEAFYRRFGFELMKSNDGYFYLLPVNERLGRRHLSSGEMLVGQALTLLYLDPATLAQGRVVSRDQVLGQLAGSMGTDALVSVFNPKRKRQDERLAEETVRAKVAEALRRLASLGFVDVVDDDKLHLRPALLRFAEPVRGVSPPEETLERLARAGEIVLTPEEGAGEPGTAPVNHDPTPDDAEDANAQDDAEDADANAPDDAEDADDEDTEVGDEPSPAAVVLDVPDVPDVVDVAELLHAPAREPEDEP